MGKILSWVLLIGFVYAVMRLIVLFQRKSLALREARLRRDAGEGSGTGAAGGSSARGKPGAADSAVGEPMIACAYCGVYAPASELRAAGGRHYCCTEHRDADAA